MSGVIGHTMYAVLGAKAAEQRKLPIAEILRRHFASYLAGSYLGCDVQIMPAAVRTATGEEIGFGSTMPEEPSSPDNPLVPWHLEFEGRRYSPRELYDLFYGRAHLLFGWSAEDREKRVTWEQLPSYLSAVAGDAIELFGPGHRQLAYVFGWMTHLVGDSLIKSVRPGVTLTLLDGKYTPRNRPIQDLVTFHEIGRKELHFDWAGWLTDAMETPVEPIQWHYMRVGNPVGQLAMYFPQWWRPDLQPLLRQVLAENRRYLRTWTRRRLAEIALTDGPGGPACHPDLRRKSGGLTYPEMVKLAEEADFRHALWQIAEAIADRFQQVVEDQPLLGRLPQEPGPTWDELTRRWRKKS